LGGYLSVWTHRCRHRGGACNHTPSRDAVEDIGWIGMVLPGSDVLPGSCQDPDGSAAARE